MVVFQVCVERIIDNWQIQSKFVGNGLQKYFPETKPCTCSGSEFLYVSCCIIVAVDFNIVHNEKLWERLRKGQQYSSEPLSFPLHKNFGIILDTCDNYGKRKKMLSNTTIKWVSDVLKRRIRPKHLVNTTSESIFCYPYAVWELSFFDENVIVFLTDKASSSYEFVCKRYYVIILEKNLSSFTSWDPYLQS